MIKENSNNNMHGTTILAIRRKNNVVIAGDGQVSLGNTIMKSNAVKVRRLANNKVIAGFAGATADAFTLFERLEGKLEKHQNQLTRACVELAKDWRTDKYFLWYLCPPLLVINYCLTFMLYQNDKRLKSAYLE